MDRPPVHPDISAWTDPRCIWTFRRATAIYRHGRFYVTRLFCVFSFFANPLFFSSESSFPDVLALWLRKQFREGLFCADI